MSIIRAKHSTQYAILDMDALEDTRLSFFAKGVYAFLHTYPADIDLSTLLRITHERNSTLTDAEVTEALTQLEQCGYITIVQDPNHE